MCPERPCVSEGPGAPSGHSAVTTGRVFEGDAEKQTFPVPGFRRRPRSLHLGFFHVKFQGQGGQTGTLGPAGTIVPSERSRCVTEGGLRGGALWSPNMWG